MNQMSRGFKKWCLPSKHINGMPDTTDIWSDLGKKEKDFFKALENYRNDPTEEKKNIIDFKANMILKARSNDFWDCCEKVLDELRAKTDSGSDSSDNQPEDIFEQQMCCHGTERQSQPVAQKIKSHLLQADSVNGQGDNSEEVEEDEHDEEDEEDEKDDAFQYRSLPEKWDGYQAMTMVSHMIYSQKNGEPKRKLNHSPILYRLEDPRTGRGENLVQVYRGVDTRTRDYRQPMRMIWDNIKEFLELDSGEFIAETLRTEDGSNMSEAGLYAQEQMLKLRYVMSNATGMSHTSGNHLGMDYKGDMLNKVELSYDNGKVAMMVCDGIPDVANLNPLAVPKRVTSLVNATIQQWKDSSPGLFVSIIWTSHDGETAEHYLYLSEYQRVKLHATIAKGFEHEWMQRDNVSGEPLFDEHQVAIDKRCVFKQSPHNVWVISEPLREQDMMMDIIRYMTRDFPARYLENILDDKETLLNHDEDDQDDQDDDEEQLVNTIDLVRPYFFSGDNMAFVVILFNTDHEVIRDMVDTYQDSRRGWYAHVLVLRYPVLKLNIDQVMINIRRKYFMRYSPNPNKWHEWLHETWHIPGERRWDDPQKYQEKPDYDDPLQLKVERDSNGNIVYPFRLLAVLPPGASWGVLKSRHDSLSSSFFVNNIESDPRVVYRQTMENTAVWDDVQLFRINAETTISRLGYERHNQSFFTFRTEEIRQGARGHPFKAYLEKYPDLQPKWRELWLERYNDNMNGWTRLGEQEPRNTENRGGRQHNQQQQRQRNRPQGRHQAQGRRQQHRANGQGQAQGRRARRRERANNNGFRPRQGQILSWQMNPKRALSERKQNEKYLVHMKYDSVKTQ